MSARSRRRAGGYLLAEAMVAGAVLLVGLSAILGAAASSQRALGVAAADQHAWQLLRERYEVQRAARLADPDWAVGSRSGTYTIPGEAPWAWAVAVTQVVDANVAGVAALTYRRAEVSLAYRGRTIRLEALRW